MSTPAATPAPEPRTLRNFFHKRLATLVQTLPGARYAGLATEDGLLIATDESQDPSPIDRRGAVMASLTAVARAAAAEFDLASVQVTHIESEAGHLLVLPFVTLQDSGPRRRLLVVVLTPETMSSEINRQAVMQAMRELTAAIAARSSPAM